MPDMNPAPADPAELAPPPEPSLLTALPWAIGAHVALLLVFALLSMSWRRSEEQSEAIEAEIWAASVQQAAPQPVGGQQGAGQQAQPRVFNGCSLLDTTRCRGDGG